METSCGPRPHAQRFATDLTDEEFAVLKPIFPAPAGIGRALAARHLQAIFLRHALWLSLAHAAADCSPHQTVYRWFDLA